MFVVQVADMHIGSSVCSSVTEEKIIKTAIETIKKKIPSQSNILIFVAGDIIDSSDGTKLETDIQKRYEDAKCLLELFDELKTEYKVCYKFCYGNHDITHQSEFFNFVKYFDKEVTERELLTSYIYEDENTSFIFANSCCDDNFEFGGLKYRELEACIQSCAPENSKVLLFHHTVFSMDEDDKAPIRDATKLLDIIRKYQIRAIFHGHTHIRSTIPVGSNCCDLIGSGAFFSRGNGDVNSQFLIIEYDQGIVREICNFHFQKDDEKWHELKLQETKPQNKFCGNDFKSVYKALDQQINWKKVLYGVNLSIETSYENFKAELESSIWNESVQFGGRVYTYGKLAQLWEQDCVPDELYFNHGSYFVVGGKSGIEYIVQQLQGNMTSSRAILSTANMEKTVQSAQDRSTYLPSLMYIQFSFDSDKVMHIQMQLRALEISRFLKINVCEILYLLDKVKKDLTYLIDGIVIEISAFRVQKKANFNCFVKAEIDKMDPIDIGILVGDNDINKICQLLDEKARFTETIIEKEGICNLRKGMLSVNKKSNIYDIRILDNLQQIQNEYDEIDKAQQHSSEISDEIEHEKRITQLIEETISLLSNGA